MNRRSRAVTPGSDFARFARRVADRARGEVWPSEKYQRDPIGFFRDVLGATMWSKPVEIAEALRDHDRVAVPSAQKVGKSFTAAGLALWWVCSFPDARVIIIAPTGAQGNRIIFREIRKLVRLAKVPIGGELHKVAHSGLTFADGREIVGLTASTPEALAGISGKHTLWIVDEASGVDDQLLEVVLGNMSGGGKLLMLSNPTRSSGFFWAACNTRKSFYRVVQISAFDSPNVAADREVIAGLATRSSVEEKAREYGKESAFYKVRVLGEFVLNEERKPFALHMIAEAEKRWHELDDAGDLQIGIDPAGPGSAGDESAFAVRRGMKVLGVFAFRGLSLEAIITNLVGFIATYRRTGERVTVAIDSDGTIGQRTVGALLAYSDRYPDAFDLHAVRSSNAACREPQNFDRIRDELVRSLELWIKSGGALPADRQLEAELHAFEYESRPDGRVKVTSKDKLRAVLGRSPDRADAVALAVWRPTTWNMSADAARTDDARDVTERTDAMSPWGGSAFDPFRSPIVAGHDGGDGDE